MKTQVLRRQRYKPKRPTDSVGFSTHPKCCAGRGQAAQGRRQAGNSELCHPGPFCCNSDMAGSHSDVAGETAMLQQAEPNRVPFIALPAPRRASCQQGFVGSAVCTQLSPQHGDYSSRGSKNRSPASCRVTALVRRRVPRSCPLGTVRE